MEITLVGLQNSGKTSFVNVIAVSVRFAWDTERERERMRERERERERERRLCVTYWRAFLALY